MSRARSLSPQTWKVLSALLEEGAQGAHGYEIIQRLGIKSGTLYPILARLVDQGFLVAKWQEPEVSGRPPRQIYRLTASGVALARRAPAGSGTGDAPSSGPVPA